MLDEKSPMFLIMPGFPVVSITVKEFIDSLKDKKICLNCKHFHKFDDWREIPAGFYFPKGECRCHARPSKDFPSFTAGNTAVSSLRMRIDELAHHPRLADV